MRQQQNIGFRKFRTHEAREHVLAKDGRIVVDQHPYFKIFRRQGVIFRFKTIENVIDQFEIIGKRQGLIDAG